MRIQDDENKVRVSMTLPESLVEAMDAAVDDSPDWLKLSRSELFRYAVEKGVDDWDEDVFELVPDELLARYRTKRETERIKSENYVIDKREGWRGRVKSYMNARLAGEEPYHPDGVEVLARNGYKDELEMLHELAPESSRPLEDDLEWLEDKIAGYREAYTAKQSVPDERPFEGVDDKVETGRDLLSLRGQVSELVLEIEERAESQAYDPDAIIRSLATGYAVSERAIEVVLDVLLPDDVDPRRALKDLESTSIEALLPPEVVDDMDTPVELEGEIEMDDRLDLIEGDLAERTLSVPADALPEGNGADIDDERAEEIVEQEIRSDGGRQDEDDDDDPELVTDGGRQVASEGHWSDWDDRAAPDGGAEDDGEEDVPETVTIRELIDDALDADRLHGLTVTRRQGDTVYCVAAQSTTWDRVDEDVDMDIDVLDLRTVVVDLEDESVRVSGNGLWVPQESGVAEALTQVLGRTTSDLAGSTEPDTPPALKSVVEGVEPELLLEREVEVTPEVEGQHTDKMENHTGIDPTRPWGYGAGPPPEVGHVVERLREAGLDPAEHLSRLVWGKKEPMDRVPRPVEELTGNYGIELQPRASGLIAIDVDYPEEFPEIALPETLEVSSPHGDDTQRHIIFRCDEKDVIAEEVGAWAVQSTQWGDLWIGDRYVVGPGSQLSEFGCDDGEHTRGERGGCEACEDPEGGYYEIVSDAPIATVDAPLILELLEASEGYTLRNGRADPDPPEADDEEDEEVLEDVHRCDNCGAARDADALKELTVGDAVRYICRGGCDV